MIFVKFIYLNHCNGDHLLTKGFLLNPNLTPVLSTSSERQYGLSLIYSPSSIFYLLSAMILNIYYI